MSKFQQGDLVQLKSGSPIMTVSELGQLRKNNAVHEAVVCVWHTGSQFEEREFIEETLERYQPQSPRRS